MAIVRLSIKGLCLFVLDQANDQVHVLMPSTARCMRAGTQMEKHEVSLVYDQAYDRPNSGRLSGKARTVRLQRCSMDTAAISSAPPKANVPSEMLDLTAFVSPADGKPIATLEPTVLPPNDDPKLLLDGRLTLSNGELTETQLGGTFSFQGSTARRAWGIEWSICRTNAGEASNPEFTWAVPGLSGEKDRELKLYPVGGMLDLFIYHLPQSQDPTLSALCGAPPSGTQAMHFCAHYDLFKWADPDQVLPYPVYVPAVKGCLWPIGGITPYTCLPGSITR